jgi:hypothetical protein
VNGFLVPIVLLLVGIVAAQTEVRFPKIREELVKMEDVDQDARIKCTNLAAEKQVNCLGEISKSIDTPDTKRLREIFDDIGFPNTAKVGKEGFQAFMILLQHAIADDLRVRSLKRSGLHSGTKNCRR